MARERRVDRNNGDSRWTGMIVTTATKNKGMAPEV
jgi:hypothetical protein